MYRETKRYFLFLLWTLLFSVPFYVWGIVAPVSGLPLGLPISFLSIFIPFGLALRYAWKSEGKAGIARLFTGIADWRRAQPWALIFAAFAMPLVVLLAYLCMRLFGLPLPAQPSIPWGELRFALLLYFLGAIPEEFGWTATLTGPLARAYGPVRTGILLGAVWAAWHILPWSWKHPWWWIGGMCLFDILLRTAMVYAHERGGGSLFAAILFHAMINISMDAFPNNGSHTDPWVMSVFMAMVLGMIVLFTKRRGDNEINHAKKEAV